MRWIWENPFSRAMEWNLWVHFSGSVFVCFLLWGLLVGSVSNAPFWAALAGLTLSLLLEWVQGMWLRGTDSKLIGFSFTDTFVNLLACLVFYLVASRIRGVGVFATITEVQVILFTIIIAFWAVVGALVSVRAHQVMYQLLVANAEAQKYARTLKEKATKVKSRRSGKRREPKRGNVR